MAEGPDVEQALAVLDTYQRQIDALSRQLSFLQAIHQEVAQARAALEGLRAEPSQEILVPLGANTFIHAQVSQKDLALTGIGAGLSVEKSWPEAEQRLAARSEEVQREMQRITEGIVRLQQEAAALQDEVQADIDRLNGGAPTGA